MFRTRAAGLVGPGRSCASFGDAFLTRTGDAHGVQRVLRSVAPVRRVCGRSSDSTHVPFIAAPPGGFVPGRCWGVLTLCSQPAKVRATRLLGFPAGQPYPADASARPLLPWTFNPLPGFRAPCGAPLRQRPLARRTGPHARPSIDPGFSANVADGRSHPLLGLDPRVGRPALQRVAGPTSSSSGATFQGKEVSRPAV